MGSPPEPIAAYEQPLPLPLPLPSRQMPISTPEHTEHEFDDQLLATSEEISSSPQHIAFDDHPLLSPEFFGSESPSAIFSPDPAPRPAPEVSGAD